MITDADAAQKLEIGERVRVDVAVDFAVDPQRLPVGGHAYAVGRRPLQALRMALSGRNLGERHAANLLAPGEIDDGETVKVRDLNEHPARRAVGVALEGHRAHAAVEVEPPDRLLGRAVDDRQPLSGDRARDHVLAVGCDESVVHAAARRNALHPFEPGSVDDVHRAAARQDCDVDTAAVPADRYVVGAAAERDLVGNPERLAAHDVQRVVGFVTEVEPAPVGGDGSSMVDLDAGDFGHDLVGSRIDEVDVVARGVGLDDTDGARGRQGRKSQDRGYHEKEEAFTHNGLHS